MKNEKVKFKADGLCRFLLRLSLFVLTMGAIFLTVSIVGTVNIKNQMRANLEPVVRELFNQSGASEVEVGIYTPPESGVNIDPESESFNAFITLHCDSLNGLRREEWYNLLSNNSKEVKIEYGYKWNQLDYAAYGRTVQVGSREYPVFVIATDGQTTYSLPVQHLLRQPVGG